MNRSNNQHSSDASLSLSMAATGDTDMCTREETSQLSATEQEQPQHQQRCRRQYRHQQQHHPSTQFLGSTTQDKHRVGSHLTEMLSSVPRSCSMRALFDAPSNLEPKACTRCSEGNDDGSEGSDSTALGFDDEDKQESIQPSSFSVETARITDIASSLSTSELILEPSASARRCIMGVTHFDTNISAPSLFPAPHPTDSTRSIDPSERQRLTSSASMTGKPVSIKRRKVGEDEGHDVDSVPDCVSGSKGFRLRPYQSSLQSSLSNKSPQLSSSPCRKRRSIQSEPPSKIPAGSKALGCACLDTSSLSLLSATSAMVSEGSISTVDRGAKCEQPLLPFQSTLSPVPLPSITQLPTFRPLDPLQDSTCVVAGATGRPLSYQQYRRSVPLLIGPCRKRSFEDAIELTRPLGNDPSIEHIGWFGSIKRRKIHHYPTRWTSGLSPTPYVKLMAIRDFWDVMMSRLDLSWLNLWAIRASTCQGYLQDGYLETMEITGADDRTSATTNITSLRRPAKGTYQDLLAGANAEVATEFGWAVCLRTRRRMVVQYPSTGISLRGLWEEEETLRRRRQMIPDGVHKPPRSKILNRKPLPRLNPHNAQPLARANLSSRSTSSSSLSHSEDKNQNLQEGLQSPSSTKTGQSATVTEVLTKKKHGPSASATVRSQALSEGYDLNEYRPWRDGTVTPHQGSFRSLRQLRRTMLGPWPAEESRAKDECTRILHRMREQLNVVINLQIHLRSMIKTVPAHMSFLLSIRHPGQVSIELLNALYGPQFMQSSAFRAIEQLLWGRKQPQRIEHHPQPQHQYSPHLFSHQYQGSQYHDHHHNYDEDEDVEELAVLSPRMDVVSAGQHFD
ncbi:hypothetical protein KVV02_002805 [Mortierella alpina]|uniref:Uncharacterized protein n=1 Tax=Mortierella alpina TaxID=64518 RepID=A0A9P8A871_MORAP|nr:hypothetical protein KVV02_002805 [Mortierella alpina]